MQQHSWSTVEASIMVHKHFPGNLKAKEFWKSVYTSEGYDEQSRVLFFETCCSYINSQISEGLELSWKWYSLFSLSYRDSLTVNKCLYRISDKCRDVVSTTDYDIWTVSSTEPNTHGLGCFHDCCLSENHYFDQLNFTFDCHDYIAVTHNRNCNRLSSSVKCRCSYWVTLQVTDIQIK